MTPVALAQQALGAVRRVLPLAVVGALAGYTWWLVQSTPREGDGARQRVASTVPDYVMRGAEVERLSAAGVRESVLRGQTMSHVPERDQLTVMSPEFFALDPKGQHLKATAERGEYFGDDALVQLRGDAQVELLASAASASGPARGPSTFHSEAIDVDTRERVVTSDQPVVLRNPQGTVHGARFRHEARTGITEVTGRVTGQFKGGVSP
ncbi:MAG: export transporter periplasmic protein LptC [Pseudomonadota bacterium]